MLSEDEEEEFEPQNVSAAGEQERPSVAEPQVARAEPQVARAEPQVESRDSSGESLVPLRPAEPAELVYEDCPTPPLRPIALPPAVQHADLLAAQEADEDCTLFRSLMTLPRDEWPSSWAKSSLSFVSIEGVLCVISSAARSSSAEVSGESNTSAEALDSPRPRIVLPQAFRSRAIHAHHLSYYGGHFGCAKTFARLAVRYWWPSMRSDVKAYMARCSFCLAHSPFTRAWRWLSLPVGTPFEVVAADIFGPLRSTVRGNTHILVLIDHHTRWVELVAMPEPTAELVAQAIFEQWISR